MRRVINYYASERRRGRRLSAMLHLFLLALAFFGLPSFLEPRQPEEPSVITVELLPVGNVSNVPNAEKAAEREEKKKESKEAEHTRKPTPPVTTAENKPPPPKEVAVPKPKKEIKKPKPKKPEKKKATAEDLAAVLKAVKTEAQQQEEKDKKEKQQSTSKNQSKSDQYNPELPMTLSEQDSIKNQLRNCWSVPAGARDAQNLIVVVDIEFAPDGSVISAELAGASKSRYNSDSFFQAAADSAIRAVHICSPLKGLPQDKYSTWHYTEMTFDPRDMLQ